MMAPRRVVITGLGVATPIGIGAESYWEALLARRCGVGPVRSFNADGLPCRIAAELPEFSLNDAIPKSYRKAAKVMSRDTQIAVVCAYHAVKDAGLVTACLIGRGESPGPPNVDAARFGANIGAGLVCADLAELAGALNTAVDDAGRFSHRLWGSAGMENLTPLWLLKFLPNMLACHVTIVHDAQANSNTITCGEASSHLAIGEAYRTIARGSADLCICGGAESKVNPMALTRPLLLGKLNTESNPDPSRACRPFSEDAAGTVAAEGGGLIVLEALEHAHRRGARIYGEIVGFGAASNAHSWSRPDPTGRPVELAVRAAMKEASVRPDDVDLVVPFGAGIPAYDASELAGWNAVLGDSARKPWAVCVKGSLGNNGAGSGAIDLATGVLALHHRTVPPSLNAASPPGFRFASSDPADARLNVLVSVTYALAGSQVAALVVRRIQE
ncbi:MAG: 3-oxoacyl-[acyl-carrier-protein] synthase 2 [Phycisphaerae bacterium]|nr:3-oxoacyl-[acyl-carrier-protein] synthase 2 [Phycisphaerae bacterium]